MNPDIHINGSYVWIQGQVKDLIPVKDFKGRLYGINGIGPCIMVFKYDHECIPGSFIDIPVGPVNGIHKT